MLEAALEIIERKLQRPPDACTRHAQPPGSRVNFRNEGEVITNEEGVVCCERGAQISKRRLEVRRAEAALDEGLFALKGDQDIVRHSSRTGSIAARGDRHPAEQQGSCGACEAFTAREHVEPRVTVPKV